MNENGGINNNLFNHLGILSTESIIVLYIAIFIIISVRLTNIAQKISKKVSIIYSFNWFIFPLCKDK